MAFVKLLRERARLRVWLGAAGVFVVGLALLYFTSEDRNWVGAEGWKSVIRELGDLLVVTVVLTLLWEAAGKRALADEIYATFGISSEVHRAGIITLTDTFHDRDLDWGSFLAGSMTLDVFVAYARTWRSTHLDQLRAFTAAGKRLTVVLPDPSSAELVAALAKRFAKSAPDVKGLIEEAIRDFQTMGGTVRLVDIEPTFTFYRFDKIAVLALYTHDPERSPVPTIVCRAGGSLYDTVHREWSALQKASRPVPEAAAHG